MKKILFAGTILAAGVFFFTGEDNATEREDHMRGYLASNSSDNPAYMLNGLGMWTGNYNGLVAFFGFDDNLYNCQEIADTWNTPANPDKYYCEELS